MRANHCSGVSLPRKYRPLTLGDLRGQPQAVATLSSFLASVDKFPTSAAFVFHGPTGVGKTVAAWALAADLGCSVGDGELGGVYEVPSGQQDGRAVEDLLRSLRLRPLLGSGWRVAVINEADGMTKQAETIWLDGLENHLPPRTVVIFTTNELGRLTDRLASRCEVVGFIGSGEMFEAALVDCVREVWKRETGRSLRKIPEGLGRFELASGEFSIRLALQQIAPYVRSGGPLPKSFSVPLVRDTINGVSRDGSAAAKKAWQTRRNKEVACV